MRPFRTALLLLLAACAPRPAPLTPSVAGGGTAGATSPALLPLERDLRAIIALHAPDSAHVAVALLDLATGDSLGIDARRPMHAASTMKVPVMLELFRRAERGELALDAEIPVRNHFRSIADGSAYALDPADDSDPELYRRVGERLPMDTLVHRMIARSSNLATNLLIELAGPERIAETLREIGAEEMRVLRGVEDGPAFRRGMNNTTSAHALLRVLRALMVDGAAAPDSRRRMLEILESQEFRDRIPAGVPAGTRVASKSGWITGIDHDAAIVMPAGRAPYLLVVLTRGFPDPESSGRAVRNLSRRVYYEMARLTPPR